MNIVKKKYDKIDKIIDNFVTKNCICKTCEYSFMMLGKRQCKEPEPILFEYVDDDDLCENHTFDKRYKHKENRLKTLQNIWYKYYCLIYNK